MATRIEDVAAAVLSESNTNTNTDSDSEYDYGSEDLDSEPTRPNRWAGQPSTWKSITQQERDLAVSLDELRNRNLSVHLYNAHALNRRAGRLLEAKASGIKIEDPINEDADKPFVPSKSWTAWPLPPDRVPRRDEQLGPGPDNVHTLKQMATERPSRELEDVLTGTVLRFAKERFQERGWESEGRLDVSSIIEDEQEDEQHDNGGTGLEALRKSNSKEQMPFYGRSHPVTGTPSRKVRSKYMSAPPEVALRPVISADDEMSAELLRPTVRHTLSKLDALLMALYHARTICRQYSSQSDACTDDETASVTATENSAITPKKYLGWPRKFESLADRANVHIPPPKEVIDGTEILRPRKATRGRKPKQYPRFEGETEEQYHIRVARLQKKPLPPFAPARTAALDSKKAASLEASSKTPTTPHTNRATPRDAARNYRRRLRLRDWSEVLGAAALVGFPPDVVARATRRCANVFGEGMTMRTMTESPFELGNADKPTTYQPEEIPDFDTDGEVVEGMLDPRTQETDEDSDEKKYKGFRLLDPLQSRFCPIKNCRRRTRPFTSEVLLRLHLRNKHQMTKDQVAEFDAPSDEEVHGAVHVDRFLRPETRKLRGKDKKQRKRRRTQLTAAEEDWEEIKQGLEIDGGSEEE